MNMAHGFSLENAGIYDRRNNKKGCSSLDNYYNLIRYADPDFEKICEVQRDYIMNNLPIKNKNLEREVKK
jgi:hypothetical protein